MKYIAVFVILFGIPGVVINQWSTMGTPALAALVALWVFTVAGVISQTKFAMARRERRDFWNQRQG